MAVEDYLAAEARVLRTEGVDDFVRTAVPLTRLGGELNVVETGTGQPVLFLPGTMTTGVVFAGLLGGLQDCRCILVERPGTGTSAPLDPPTRTLAAQREAADALLVDILDGLVIETADVVSTSFGGFSTFRSLAAHPDRFGRVFAFGFQVGARLGDIPLSMRAPSLPPRFMPKRVPATPALVRSMLKTAGVRGAIESGRFSDVMVDWMVALLKHTETFRNESLDSARPADLRGEIETVRHSAELLAKVTHPVHLFWGTDDYFGGEAVATEFANLLPNATLEMVEGAEHAPWIDQPDKALAALRSHLMAET